MTDNRLKEAISDLLPPLENRLTLDEVVAILKKKGIAITRRTIQYYCEIGVIPKPIHIGRNAYFEGSIIDQLCSLFILKNMLHFDLEDITMSLTNTLNLTEVVKVFRDFLKHYYDSFCKNRKTQAFIFQVENDRVAKRIIEKLASVLGRAEDPHGIDKNKFIEETIKETRTVKVKIQRKNRADTGK
ncbi:MAG: hypothetical protein PHR44_07460 [Candidatus Omnitrophica bacterium]|nr:hypothetical protein [Candidatus Omnitrophota bacterium]